MKLLSFVLLLACLCLLACSDNVLTNENARTLIKQNLHYPEAVQRNIYVADPVEAREILDKGLEEDGLVMIEKKQQLKDIGKPLVHFTQKAEPFLIAANLKDTGLVQPVRLGVVDIDNIAGIKIEGKSAKVEYTVIYRDLTPFSKLSNKAFKNEKKHYACFELYDTGWKYVKCLY